jgi:hypothetical protein
MNYLMGNTLPPKGVCRLGILENVPEWAEMQNGERQRDFPADACFRMSPDFPKDVKLADVLPNDNRFVVGSERFVELLRAAKALARNDVFEVGILNHKGRREKAKYFLVHQYDFPRCVDAKATVGERSAMDADEYIALTKLVLDERRIPKDLALFRPREYNNRPFFRRDVAQQIMDAGITGLHLVEIDQVKRF